MISRFAPKGLHAVATALSESATINGRIDEIPVSPARREIAAFVEKEVDAKAFDFLMALDEIEKPKPSPVPMVIFVTDWFIAA